MDRRTVLKAGGIALTGTMFTTTASASSSKSTLEQIDQEVFEAYIEDGEDAVAEVMNDRGLNYKISSKSKELEMEESSDSGFQTQGHYTEASSNVSVYAFEDPEADNRIRVQTIANIDGLDQGFGYANWAEDLVSITYNSSHWTNVGESSLRINPGSIGSVDLFPGSIDGGGISAVVDLDLLPVDGFNVLLAQSLENGTGTPAPVYGSYIHSWSYNPTQVTVESVSAGAGPLSATFSGPLEYEWPITEDASTDGLI